MDLTDEQWRVLLPPIGRCHWIVEIDTIDYAGELDTERNAARERTEYVAEVPTRVTSFCWADFFRERTICKISSRNANR
jgi:hypothetical protein